VILDVTDATFRTEVLDRSATEPVVVDLWAPWCGPCRTLGPILERVVEATDGRVTLAKINVDENPSTMATFAQSLGVQGIPAVFAFSDGKVVDGFIGAQPEVKVQAFVDGLLPTEEESELAGLLAAGDEGSLRRALELEPGNERAVVGLAEILVDKGEREEALALLGRVPESAETRRVAALARTGVAPEEVDVTAKLDALLDRVKGDDAARQEFVDLLELLGPEDPRTSEYRRQLTARLF
jgi:putative thioredoxin